MDRNIPISQEARIELAEKASKLNILLIGPPGSGKSTLVRNLSDLSSNILYISAGEITRRKMAEGGEVADQIYQLYLTEQPWPDEFVAGLMLPDLIASAERGFVLDGIPRKASESAVLIDLLAKNGVKLDLVINLFSDYETSMQRIMMRMENEDKRPEKLDHYKVRLDMYWKGIAVMRETLGSIAKFVDIDATRAAPAEILDNLFSHLNNL